LGYLGLAENREAFGRPGPALYDGVGRRIDHLRLSVMSACDLHCRYCRPVGLRSATVRTRSMTHAMCVELVSWLTEDHGLSKVRITGGEPLLAAGLVDLVAAIKAGHPELTLVLTTNASRLAFLAEPLRDAGIERVNVSLDTLRADRFASLTGGDLSEVLGGIEAARRVGFEEIKVNVVALKGINEDEFADLLAWGCRQGFEVRFLEAMPIGPAADFNRRHFLSGAQMRRIVGQCFELTPLPQEFGLTARRYAVSGRGVSGVCGFITPVSEPFCGQCRRIRVTEHGRLFPCLLDSRSFDLMPAWRDGHLDTAVAERVLRLAVEDKAPRGTVQATPMVALGG